MKGKRYAVLGDMLELGEQGPQMHAGLATKLDPQKINEVFLCGPLMENLAQALLMKYEKASIHHYQPNRKELLLQDLKAKLTADDMVMLKGSHGIHLEQVLQGLMS